METSTRQSSCSPGTRKPIRGNGDSRAVPERDDRGLLGSLEGRRERERGRQREVVLVGGKAARRRTLYHIDVMTRKTGWTAASKN